MQGDPVKEFRDSFGKECPQMGQIRDVAMQAIKTGKGADGTPVNVKELQDFIPFANAVVDACANVNLNTVRRVIEVSTDRKIGTCKAFNSHAKMQFKTNGQTPNWISQEGPSGPCGTVNISTLKQEKPLGYDVKGVFWSYTQKRIFTNPSGVLSNGVACSKFAEHTTNYSWQTPSTLAGCKYIQHMP
jgi:hypothetical protein